MEQKTRLYAGHHTIAKWNQWQDHWELIDGVPYYLNSTLNVRHQRLNTLIPTLHQNNLSESKCSKCKVYISFGWQISDDTVVQSAVPMMCKPNTGIRLMEPTAVIFEFLSPPTRQKDQTAKFDLCQEQKVPDYIKVDPETSDLAVIHLQKTIT